jgi:hypothetical protein
MPECFCPEELGGACYFEPVTAELFDWMPTHEHFPRSKRGGDAQRERADIGSSTTPSSLTGSATGSTFRSAADGPTRRIWPGSRQPGSGRSRTTTFWDAFPVNRALIARGFGTQMCPFPPPKGADPRPQAFLPANCLFRGSTMGAMVPFVDPRPASGWSSDELAAGVLMGAKGDAPRCGSTSRLCQYCSVARLERLRG